MHWADTLSEVSVWQAKCTIIRYKVIKLKPWYKPRIVTHLTSFIDYYPWFETTVLGLREKLS